MKVNKNWLSIKVEQLNDWLDSHSTKHFEYRLKRQNRDYYVRKLIELEENHLESIAV